MRGLIQTTRTSMVAALAATMLALSNDASAQANASLESILKAMELDGVQVVSSVSYRSKLERVILPNAATPPLHFDFRTLEHADGRFFSEYFRVENGVKTDSSSTVCWDGNSFSELQHKGRLLRFGSALPRDVNPFNLSGWIALPWKPLLYMADSPKRFILLSDLANLREALKKAQIQIKAVPVSDDDGKESKLWQVTRTKDSRQFRIWTKISARNPLPILRWEEWSSGQIVARCVVLESKWLEDGDVRYPYATSMRLQYFSSDSKAKAEQQPDPDSEWIVSVHDLSINRAHDDDFLIDPSSATEVYSVDEGVVVTVPR